MAESRRARALAPGRTRPGRMLPALVVAVALAAAGGACSTADTSASGGAPTTPTTATPTTVSGEDCWEEYTALRRAVQDFEAKEGRFPTDTAALRAAGLLVDQPEPPRYDLRARPQPGTPPQVVPAPGSPCPAEPKGPVLRERTTEDTACAVDKDTIATAITTYKALNDTAPTSIDQLVEAGLLEEAPVTYALAPDGTIVPAPGSTCP